MAGGYHLHHYEDRLPAVVAKDSRALRYRRRVLSPRRIENRAPWVRPVRITANLLMAGVTVYAALYFDWGPNDATFSGLRSGFEAFRRRFFRLSELDEKEIALRQASRSTSG